uniref:Leucine rich immune protein (Coil-less) n=1 Tax=Anopheles culicifacies TaxID=139723 RepID=A0A182LVG6_9DIPT
MLGASTVIQLELDPPLDMKALKNFAISTFDRSTIKHLPPSLERLEISYSRALQRFVLPNNFNISRVTIIKTHLSWVELQRNDAIQMLSIVLSKLQHVPSTLKNLKNLTNIKLQQSFIHQLNLDLLQWFPGLLSLELMQNRIRTIKSTLNGGQQRKLESLNLRHNQLRIINLEVLSPLGWFKYVDLSHNKIELLVGRFSSDRLVAIILSHNRLKALDFCQWKPIPSLHSISLDTNELTRVPNCMHHLSNLSYICFSNNKLAIVNMDVFGEMDNLTNLDLTGNHISSITFREEKYPKRLKELNLSENKIECNNPHEMPFCPLDIEFQPSSPDSAWKRNNNTLQRQLTITTG